MLVLTVDVMNVCFGVVEVLGTTEEVGDKGYEDEEGLLDDI